MEKIFVHIAKKSSFTTELQTKYTNSIVFIKDSGEIYTHGKFYGLSTEWQNRITSAESDIDALQLAVAALQEIHPFTTISDGVNSASATAAAKTIKFNGTGKATVTVGIGGVTIDAAGTTLTEGTANGQTSVDGISKSIVKGLNTAAYHPDTYFYKATDGQAAATAAANAQATADAKVASVTAAPNSGIAITGTATEPIVGLKLDTTTPGNVTLTQGANGLKAAVTIPAATVTGVVSNDKVLSLDGTNLKSTLDITYDSANKLIKLIGIDNTVIGSISAADFIKDGMVDSVAFNPSNKKLTITFNTDSGKEDIEVDLTSLVDTYSPGNGIEINNNVVSVKKDSTSETFLTVGTGGIKLAGVNDAIDAAKNAVIGDGNDGASEVTIYGAKAYALSLASNYATSEQGSKADTALQEITKGTDGTYVTTTVGAKTANKQAISTSVTIQSVTSASATAKGLAEASDVKTYVDSKFLWEEL